REAALFLRDQRERAWEQAHAEAMKEGLGSGWAVNGVEAALKALAKGQVRTLLADGQNDDARIDDAIEEALRQRAQVDVLYDDTARRAVDGLAALLRFRRRWPARSARSACSSPSRASTGTTAVPRSWPRRCGTPGWK